MVFSIPYVFSVELEDEANEEIVPDSIPEQPKKKSEARGLFIFIFFIIYSFLSFFHCLILFGEIISKEILNIKYVDICEVLRT